MLSTNGLCRSDFGAWTSPRSLLCTILLLCLFASSASAQIARRNFVNPSFEEPDLDTACAAGGNTFRQIDADSMPGWETTHSLFTPGTACGGATPYRPIEVWESGFLSVPAQDADQFVELNANEASRIYQSACLLANETVSYQYYHRSRSGNPETSRAVLFDETGTTQIDQGPDDAVNVADGWVLHSGTLTNDASNGPRQIGFISIVGGSVGNFLDMVEVQLRPLVELVASSNAPDPEETGTAIISFVVNGELQNPATFTLVLDGASTASADDFSIATGPLVGRGNIDSFSAVDGTITITMPAGFYNPNDTDNTNGEQGLFNVPLTFNVDATIEPDEVIVYVTGAVTVGGGNTAARDLEFNDSDCDGSLVPSVSATILNDDIDLAIDKTLDTPEPYTPGKQVQYTLTVTNTAPGAATATNVVITDTPINLIIDSFSSTNCNAFPCVIPSLAAGESEVITILATIDNFGVFNNRAAVTADQSDANTANNSDRGTNRSNGGIATSLPVPSAFVWSLTLMALGVMLLGRKQLARR